MKNYLYEYFISSSICIFVILKLALECKAEYIFEIETFDHVEKSKFHKFIYGMIYLFREQRWILIY